MYIGHVAIALGGKGVWRDAPLWLLVAATQASDWIDAGTCLAGSEPDAMWSHSIPAVLVIAVVVWLLARGSTSSRTTGAVAAGVAISHYLVDCITGRKVTWPGGPIVGFNLYHHPGWEFVFEAIIIWAGWFLYRRSLQPGARTTRPAYLLLFLLIGLQVAADAKVALSPSPSKCQWTVPPAEHAAPPSALTITLARTVAGG